MGRPSHHGRGGGQLLHHIFPPIANPRYMVPEWTFGIEEENLQKVVDQARAGGARVVVLLSHNGMDVDVKLASRVTGIDAILGGHTHDVVWFHEWPVRARTTGEYPRLLVGEVDLFLELPEGFVLVDHKSFPGGEAERDERLTGWAQQLGWYALVLARVTGKPLRAAFIHLPIRG